MEREGKTDRKWERKKDKIIIERDRLYCCTY